MNKQTPLSLGFAFQNLLLGSSRIPVQFSSPPESCIPRHTLQAQLISHELPPGSAHLRLRNSEHLHSPPTMKAFFKKVKPMVRHHHPSHGSGAIDVCVATPRRLGSASIVDNGCRSKPRNWFHQPQSSPLCGYFRRTFGIRRKVSLQVEA